LNYIVVGSAGGLGSFLWSEFKKAGYNVFGIDVLHAPTVDSIIPPTQNVIAFSTAISILFDSHEGPWTIVISIAMRNRSKCCSYEFIQDNISEVLSLNSELLAQTARCLSRVSTRFAEQSHIINIGSVLCERFSSKESPIYGASKAAAKSLVRDLAAISLKDNICINSISPALLFRNEMSFEYLNKYLLKYSEYIQPTSYEDIYKLIKFISLSGVRSLRGKDIILDFGLEDIEGFDIMSRLND